MATGGLGMTGNGGSNISKRSLGLKKSGNDPTGRGAVTRKTGQASPAKPGGTRGFTPPGAKKAGGNGRAIEGVRKTPAGRQGTSGSKRK